MAPAGGPGLGPSMAIVRVRHPAAARPEPIVSDEYLAAIRRIIAATRRDQGLPAAVDDPVALAEIVELLEQDPRSVAWVQRQHRGEASTAKVDPLEQ